MAQGKGLKGAGATVFGGSGFIGRHLVQRLARGGARVRVAVRDPERAAFLKPFGDPGQVVPVACNIRDDAAVARAVDGADAVVNLVAILYETAKQTFPAIHVEGARRIAAASASAGVRRLVHVSALGASRRSPAVYGRTKAAGEAAVAEAFPDATIVRPSVVFGPEDDFFNRFARLARISWALPLIGGDVADERPFAGLMFRGHRFGAGTARFQPVYVGDVADAIMRILARPDTAGQTYELGGPEVYDLRGILEIVLRETGRCRLLLPVPYWLADFEARFLELLPKPLLTRDQVKLLKRDTIVAPDAQGFDALGITPTTVETIVPGYLARYRRGGAGSAAPQA